MKTLLLSAFLSAALATSAWSQQATVAISVKDHKFSPAEAIAPPGQPLSLVVTNQDRTPVEFESKALRVEKLVPAGATVTLKVRALEAGRYRFFDDYHEDTTHGFLVVQ